MFYCGGSEQDLEVVVQMIIGWVWGIDGSFRNNLNLTNVSQTIQESYEIIKCRDMDLIFDMVNEVKSKDFSLAM